MYIHFLRVCVPIPCHPPLLLGPEHKQSFCIFSPVVWNVGVNGNSEVRRRTVQISGWQGYIEMKIYLKKKHWEKIQIFQAYANHSPIRPSFSLPCHCIFHPLFLVNGPRGETTWSGKFTLKARIWKETEVSVRRWNSCPPKEPREPERTSAIWIELPNSLQTLFYGTPRTGLQIVKNNLLKEEALQRAKKSHRIKPEDRWREMESAWCHYW